ncbi:O-antigen ligase family protein [Priestia flexa]|uniref:O-antigen ligase family protein n=1 Tax=Priestia flexa TaxID=86664 RepID=UPI003CFFF016
MKLKNNVKLIDIIFFLCIMSIFIKFTFIYPVFFTVFIILSFIIELKNNQNDIRVNYWQMFLILFSFWVCFVNYINGNSDIVNIIKFYINIFFLIAIPFYLRTLNKRYPIIQKKIFLIIEILIFANFLQILTIYFTLNVFTNIISNGVTNSDAAYYITSNPNLILLGSESKNIWSTKIALIQIVYLIGINLNLHKRHKIFMFLINLIAILNVFMLLGRTAQLAYIVVLGFIIFKEILKAKQLFYLYLSLIGSGFLLIKVIPIIYDKIFHINFNITDGGFIRLQYWITFVQHFTDTNYIIGNGFFSAKEFLSNYAYLYIGETNMHNVLLNNLLDWGIVGTILYSIFIILFLKAVYDKLQEFFMFVITIVMPLTIIMSLQYLGYDNDLMIFFALIMILSNIYFTKSKKEEFI